VYVVDERHLLSRGKTLLNISHTWSRRRGDKRPLFQSYEDCPGLQHNTRHKDAGAFYKCTNQWPGHLFIMDSAGGRNRRQLTFSWELPYVRGHGANQNVPAWSRTNGWVAYMEGQILTGPTDVVAILPGDKQHATTMRLTYGAETGWMGDDPEWSPDGNWLAFAAYHAYSGAPRCYIATAYVGEWPPRDREQIELGTRFQAFPAHVTFTQHSCNYAPLPSWQTRPTARRRQTRKRHRQSQLSSAGWRLPWLEKDPESPLTHRPQAEAQ
jgi:hypothetical protein